MKKRYLTFIFCCLVTSWKVTSQTQMKITVGMSIFTATLENSPIANSFRSLLPMTITMNELNGNEKYFYLPNNLPTDASSSGFVSNGDIMLYGSNCLVLFYKSFSTSYKYTRLGRIDNPEEFAMAVGSGNINVIFEEENTSITDVFVSKIYPQIFVSESDVFVSCECRSLTLFTITGVPVALANGNRINISFFNPGVYLLKISLENEDKISKIIKQ